MSGIMLTDQPVRRPRPVGSPLVRKIQRACRAVVPDLGLNLDVADYVNDKQGAAPRDAVLLIVKIINHGNPHSAVCALNLLDVLVKNCGYPLHLQISRKEFLNELVKGFPERPPSRFSKVEKMILTAIEEWYQTICKHSTYKEDMGYIRDMHRLLKYKGYTFPHIKEEDLSVLKPSNHLKTASEIQKEQEIAQAAKLEELIRRGRPEDLREANKLMKVMAGFKEDNAIQAKNAIKEELTKLQRKADLFKEMLASPELDVSNETVQELYSALKVSQPKFQKIIEEEQDDQELVTQLLSFNDVVNQLIQQFFALKGGDSFEAQQLHAPAESNGAQGSDLLDLLDFDDNKSAAGPNGNSAAAQQTAENDLLGDLLGDLGDLNLSAGNSSGFGAGGSISLNASSPPPQVPASASTSSNANAFDLLGDLSSPSSVPAQTSESAAAPSNTYDLLGGFQSTPSSNPSSATNVSTVLISESSHLKIEFAVSREGSSTVKIHSFFSNIGPSPISDFTFMIAVPKTYELKLESQSSSFMSGGQKNGITQVAFIENVPSSLPKPLKIKWKCNYSVNGVAAEETAVAVLPTV
ncbi:hypothetical protein ACO0QE_004546 [Hanseniaspora vineae]